MATSTIAMQVAIGMMALILAFAAITTPMAAAQTLEEDDGEAATEEDQTTTAFFPEDNQTRRLSILGALGISVVEGVKVTGMALNENGSEVTVTVSSVDNSTNTTATTNPGVTVAAFKTQLDLASLLQGHMMKESQGAMPHTLTGEGEAQGQMMQNYGGIGSMKGSGMPMFDITSFIESLEIGSNIEQEGWESPADLTVPVISGDTASNATANMTAPTGTSDTEVVIVVVIPYTGETGTAETVSTEEQAQVNDTSGS